MMDDELKPTPSQKKDSKQSAVIHEKTSVLLQRLTEDLDKPTIQVGMLLYLLRRRSFGGLLLFLALLSLIPGISFFTGIIIIVIGAQLMLGLRAPKLPRLFNEYGLEVDKLKVLLTQFIPKIIYVERYVKPRWYRLTNPPTTFFIGFFIILLALVVIIPLPFTGLLPVVALLLFALGILERDGALIAIGGLIGLISIVIGLVIAKIALSAF